MSRLNRNTIIGFGTIALALLGWFVIIPVGVTVPSSVTILALSPDFWPKIIMVILAVCGAVVLLQGISQQKAPPISADSNLDSDEIVYYAVPVQTVRVCAAFAGLFAFYALSPLIGMVVGCMILVAAATRGLGVESRAKSVGLAIILPALLYFFFTEVAHIPIPLGLLEELR